MNVGVYGFCCIVYSHVAHDCRRVSGEKEVTHAVLPVSCVEYIVFASGSAAPWFRNLALCAQSARCAARGHKLFQTPLAAGNCRIVYSHVAREHFCIVHSHVVAQESSCIVHSHVDRERIEDQVAANSAGG